MINKSQNKISMSITISQQTLTRESLIEKIVLNGVLNNFTVFGGYVRDNNILENPKKVNDIDFAVFGNGDNRHFNIEQFINKLSEVGIGLKKITSVSEEKENYKRMSKSIKRVDTYEVLWYRGIVGDLPDNFKVRVDFVHIKGSIDTWKQNHDIDFSCNIFIETELGTTIRHTPSEYITWKNMTDESVRPFSFYKKMIKAKIFSVVMDILYGGQMAKLVTRAKKLINNGWAMSKEPWVKKVFSIGPPKELVGDDTYDKCSICHTDFDGECVVVNTWCDHQFCPECICTYWDSKFKELPDCPNCRSVYKS